MMDRLGAKARRAFTINLRMIPSKLAYILYGGILGLHLPFLNIFFTSVGLTKTEAGLISGIRYTSSSLAGPMWGILADYTGRRKLIMVAICVGSAFPIFFMPWIAHEIYPMEKNDTCVSHNVTGNTSLIITDEECEEDKKDQLETLFYTFLAIIVFASIFIISMPGYVDSTVINIVKSDKNNASYGAQRIFGSIGFSVFTFLGGIAADKYHSSVMSRYTAVFFLFLPCCILMIPIGCYVVGQVDWDEQEDNTGSEESSKRHAGEPITWENSITRQVLLLFKKFDVTFFMATVFIGGLANSLFLSFSFLLVDDTMTVSKTELTLVTVAGSGSELLVFPFTSKIIKKVGGTSPCITIGIFSFVIRFLAMSYVQTFWVIVLIQMLHGLGFALAWAAMMEHTHKIAPKDIIVTVFGILSGIYFSLAPLVANVVGGIVYEAYGGRVLFRWMGAIIGVWTVLMIIYYGGKHVKNTRTSKLANRTVKYRMSQNETKNGDKNEVAIVSYETGIVNPLGALEEPAEDRLETMETT